MGASPGAAVPDLRGIASHLRGLAPLDRDAVAWLLEADEPAVRYLVATEVLGVADDDPSVRALRAAIPDGPRVRLLLGGQRPDGGFGVPAYAKWSGTHWRLIALVELAVPVDDRIRAAAEHELAWIGSSSRLRRARAAAIAGRFRWCGSQEGAALAVCSRIGMAGDERVAAMARALVAWQWPDGGWNCDVRPEAARSSFHESLKTMWGLFEYAEATGDRDAAAAAGRAADFFLRHRLFRSERTGEGFEKLLRPHFPSYWHYDAPDALLRLAPMGRLGDPRAVEALDALEARRLQDGRWAAGGRHWRPPGSSGANVEVVDWGRRGPNPFVTLNALRVLRAAGRLTGQAPPAASIH